MKILQGKYLRPIESGKGRLKGIELKTTKGNLVVKVPKALSAIAQAELTEGDEIRIWALQPEKTNGKNARQASTKNQKLTALQIIPLTPHTKVSVPECVPKVENKKTKDKKKKNNKPGKKKLTVQLCQKKNCCKKGADELWVAFEKALQATKANAGAVANRETFKLEAVGCLGGCKNGPNIRLLPKNVKHRNVKPSDVQTLLRH